MEFANNAITFTVSNTAGLSKTFTNSYSGQQLIVRVWVKLGTATIFALVMHNVLGWNTVGGKCFTSADGLNTSTYSLCQLVVVVPSSVSLAINVGSHAQSMAAQTSGTLLAYGWNIIYYNKILDVNGVIQMPSAISTTSATLTGALSAGSATLTGASSAGSATLTGGLSCSSMTLTSVAMFTPSYIMF